MNLKGHLATGIVITNIFSLPFLKTGGVIDRYLNIQYIKYLDNFLGIFNIKSGIIMGLLFLIGAVIPDLDQLLKNYYKHYTEYHRQITHSLFLGLFFNITIFYLYLFYFDFLKYFLVFFSGILLHIIIDIFFGKGGIPLFLYTNRWNSKFRVSIPLFSNSGIVSNIIISISYILLLYLSYLNFHNYLYLVVSVFYIFLLTSIKNTLTSIKYLFIALIISVILFFII